LKTAGAVVEIVDDDRIGAGRRPDAQAAGQQQDAACMTKFDGEVCGPGARERMLVHIRVLLLP